MEQSWQLAQRNALAPHERSDRLFFFPEELPEQSRNLSRRYAAVEKLGPVRVQDDGFSLATFCGTIVPADDGMLRMYATARSRGLMRVVLLLSADGLTWTAPDLGQEPRSGLPSNALVFDGAPNSPVDAAADTAGEPARTTHDQVGQPQVVRLEDGRWRMYYWHHQHGWGRVPYLYTIAVSDDGLRWRVPDYESPALNAHWCGEGPQIEEAQRLAELSRRTNDAVYVYRNPWTRVWELYSQWFVDSHPDRAVPEDNCPAFNRMIQRRTSEDGRNWSLPELVIQADDRDPWDLQFYHLAVQYHEDWMIGSLGHYRVEEGQQTMDLELAFSRDGRSWHRPLRGGFIPREPGAPDGEGIYPPNAWIDEGETWLCLYTGTGRKHNRHDDESQPGAATYAARFAKHRLVGLDAGSAGGGFTSDVFYPRGEEIRLDADVRGSLRAELCDAWGRKIRGCHLMDSVPVRGDSGGHVLRWADVGTAAFRFEPVRVRLEFADATVYGIEFG